MSAESKKIDISSTKSMDVTTKKVTDVPVVNDEAPKIVLNGQKHIKDVSPVEEAEDSSSTTKIKISENLASNLKSPIETKKIIEPIEQTEKNISEDKPSDDLTDSSDKSRDESFIDKISDDESKDDESAETNDQSSEGKNEEPAEKDSKSTELDSDKTNSENSDSKPADDEKVNDEKTETETKTEQPQDSGDEGIVNELAEQAADNKKQKQEAKVQDERNQKIEALIAEKKYFVPIGQITHRRNTRLFIIVILLLIISGLFAVNLAIDAGMLDIGVEPLTDIIAL